MKPMKSYEEIKSELRRETHQSLRYFTKAFYATYCKAVETIRYNIEHDIDDSYEDNGIYTLHAFDDVRKSDFYLKSGSAYCTFLCIVGRIS